MKRLSLTAIVLAVSAFGCTLGTGGNLADNYRSSVTTALVWSHPSSIDIYISPSLTGTETPISDDDNDAVREAFRAWTSGLGGMNVVFVNSASGADIVVSFDKSSPAVTTARTTVTATSSGDAIESVSMLLVTQPSPYDLRLTAVHEAGRALGVVAGESNNPFDVMTGLPNLVSNPTSRDLSTLTAIYAEQGITL